MMKNKYCIDFMSYIGRHTLTIFTWHVLVFKIVESLLSYANLVKMTHGWKGEYTFNDWWWLYTICGITVPLLLLLFWEKLWVWSKKIIYIANSSNE